MIGTLNYYPVNCTPTVFPEESFDAAVDAAILLMALDNTDIEEMHLNDIIQVLGNRTYEQRMEIASEYDEYPTILIDHLQTKLTGNFKHAIIALMTDPAEFHARELHNNEEGILNEELLLEFLASHSNYAIQTLNESYESMYNSRIIDNLVTTDAIFRQFISNLLLPCRSENNNVDQINIDNEITSLSNYYATDKNQWKGMLFEILERRSYQELFALNKKDFLCTMIKNEFEKEIYDLYYLFIKCASNKNYYFALSFLLSFKDIFRNGSVNDKNIIRIIVARSEIDLGDIKEAFRHLYDNDTDIKMEQYINQLPEKAYKKLLNTILS